MRVSVGESVCHLKSKLFWIPIDQTSLWQNKHNKSIEITVIYLVLSFKHDPEPIITINWNLMTWYNPYLSWIVRKCIYLLIIISGSVVVDNGYAISTNIHWRKKKTHKTQQDPLISINSIKIWYPIRNRNQSRFTFTKHTLIHSTHLLLLKVLKNYKH